MKTAQIIKHLSGGMLGIFILFILFTIAEPVIPIIYDGAHIAILGVYVIYWVSKGFAESDDN